MARRRGPSQRPETWRFNHSSPLASGLVFAHLGQVVGSTTYRDSSVYSNDGTLVGYTGAGNLPKDRWGWSDYLKRPTLSFNGSSDYVEFSSTVSSLYRFTSELFWCSFFINTSNFAVVPVGDGYYQIGGWYVYIRSDGSVLFATQATGAESSVATAAGTIPAGVTTHVMAQRTGTTTASIYINGRSVSVTGAVANCATSSYNLRIGALSGTSSNFVNGVMSDMLIGLGNSSAFAPALSDPSNYTLSGLLLPVRRYWGTGFNTGAALRLRYIASGGN